MAPRQRDREDEESMEENPFEEYCPSCGQYLGGESICLNCGAEAFNESGVEEYNEDELDGGMGDLDDDGL